MPLFGDHTHYENYCKTKRLTDHADSNNDFFPIIINVMPVHV